eukprot:3199712-Amphidinium_carterae.1
MGKDKGAGRHPNPEQNRRSTPIRSITPILREEDDEKGTTHPDGEEDATASTAYLSPPILFLDYPSPNTTSNSPAALLSAKAPSRLPPS